MELGDTVYLNSGSPPLRVEAIDGEEITVSWRGEPGRETFQACCLRPGWRIRPDDDGPEPAAAALVCPSTRRPGRSKLVYDKTNRTIVAVAAMSDTHRPDETAETAKQDADRAATEGHVAGVEQAVDKGLLSRRQAERVIGAGQKAHRSHDMARGISQKE